MIYTLTMNPSIDLIMDMADGSVIEYGQVNRTVSERCVAGGKGINVATVLNNLGLQTTATGIAGGFTGREIIKKLNEAGVTNKFVVSDKGESRINVKIRDMSDAGRITEINGSGPVISESDKQELTDMLNCLDKNDWLVISGNVCKGCDTFFYKNIIERCKSSEVKVILDCTGEVFLNALSCEPFLVKPNDAEIEEMTGIKADSEDNVIKAARMLIDRGAQNVLVSMGDKGACLVRKDGKAYYRKAPAGDVINTVGAGDSMVAGFIYGYEHFKDACSWENEVPNQEMKATNREKVDSSWEYILECAVAAGSASAFKEGLTDLIFFQNVLKSIAK